MKFSKIIFFLVLSCLSIGSYSQTSSPNNLPYKFGWKHEMPYLVSSVGFLSTGYLLEKTNKTKPFTIQELNSLNKNDINSFDRGATYYWSENLANKSDVLLMGAIVAPVVFLTTKSTRKNMGWLLLMGLEVFSINYGATLSAKNLMNRTRPYVYNTELSYETRTGNDSRKAFISGHTSTAAAMSFFIATVISDYHPDMHPGLKIGLWSVATIYPAVTGYLRVASGKHFPTDVIAGYAVGAFTGWLIPFLHKKRHKEDKFSFAPVNINGNAGLYFSYKF